MNTQTKKTTKIFGVVLFVFGMSAVGVFALKYKPTGENQPQIAVQSGAQNAVAQSEQAINVTEQAAPSIQPNSSSASTNGQNVQPVVPFIVQAPFANWSDPIFQNACEEASVVMAMGWINGKTSISPHNVSNQILDIVAFENKTFGYNADTNVFDIARIFKEHFNQQNVRVQENITSDDIKGELQKGNLVLVPAFGQALGNPNYTAPGPIGHMLTIIGYDANAKQFVTNDPGTKHGKGYRYAENVLFNAIWEYPSGDGPLNPPAKADMKKAMVIVSKN